MQRGERAHSGDLHKRAGQGMQGYHRAESELQQVSFTDAFAFKNGGANSKSKK